MKKNWNNIMFDYIGIKIQKIAKIIAWSCIVLSIIGGIIMFLLALSNIKYLWPLLFLSPIITIFICFISWLSVICLYGFGKLIEDVGFIRNRQENEKNAFDNCPNVENQPIQDDPNNISRNNQHDTSSNLDEDDYIDVDCPNCQEPFSYLKNQISATCPWCDTVLFDYSEKKQIVKSPTEINLSKIIQKESIDLNAIPEPINFNDIYNWEESITSTDTNLLLEQLNDDSYSTEYRYLCQEELKRRM